MTDSFRQKFNKSFKAAIAIALIAVFIVVNPLRIAAASLNDPGYENQFYIDQIGAADAWDLINSVYHEKVKVAVVDTGADIYHEDLANIINRELSVDVAKNGYPQMTSDTIKTWGHGTCVASVIGAEANNNKGIAGVASCGDNSILDLFVIRADTDDLTYNDPNLMAKGIIQAVDEGARVINISMTVYESTENLKKAVKYAYDNGVIIVGCAGNFDGLVSKYPASYSEVIQVSGITEDNYPWYGSNYNEDVDLCAYSEDIYMARTESRYFYDNGTSFAAPQVTATIAMMLSVNPQLSWSEVYMILTSTSDDLQEEGFDKKTGFGRVNAYEAVRTAIEVSDGTIYEGTGDLDGDGTVSSRDYIILRQWIINQTEISKSEMAAADMNRDGRATSADYIKIKKYIMYQ